MYLELRLWIRRSSVSYSRISLENRDLPSPSQCFLYEKKKKSPQLCSVPSFGDAMTFSSTFLLKSMQSQKLQCMKLLLSLPYKISCSHGPVQVLEFSSFFFFFFFKWLGYPSKQVVHQLTSNVLFRQAETYLSLPVSRYFQCLNLCMQEERSVCPVLSTGVSNLGLFSSLSHV